MANNVNIPAQGTGDTTPKVSTDQVTADQSQVQNFQMVAVAGGVLTRNPTVPVSNASLPLPAGAATSANQATDQTLTGGVTETAPGTDTASSGLNGRLQRIAQRLSSLIALLPTSLGQKTMANGLAVTVASDQSALPISDNAGSLTVDAPVGTPVFARLSDGTAALTTTGSRLAVDGSGVTQPVSGTVTANIGTVGTLATEATQTAQSTLYGAVTETAPGTDTASSGLNGRLQRIAQNITTLLGRLPAALGQTTKAGSLSVTLASNQDALPITDNAGSLTVDNGGTFAVQDSLAETALGAPTDAAATTTGSVIAQLRRIANELAGTLTVTGGGGGTQYVEDVASAGGETVTLAGAIRQDTLATSTSTDGDFTNLKTNAAGSLYVTGGGGGTQFAEDAAHVSGDLGTMALGVRKDTATALSGTDGDYTPLITDASGRQHVNVGTSALPTGASTAAKQPALGTAGASSADVISVQGIASGTALPVSGAVSVTGTMPVDSTKAEDAVHASGDTGAFVLGVRKDTATQLAGTDGDYSPIITDASGRVHVNGSGVTQPVSGTVTTTPPANASTNVAQVAGTTTDTNSGAKSAGTQRVVLATDQPALTNALKVDGSAVTQPVSAASLPLPTGAAADATLTGGTQKSKLVDTGGTNVASVSAAGALKVDASGVAVPITDNAGSLTVDNGGTFAVQPTQPSASTGAVTAFTATTSTVIFSSNASAKLRSFRNDSNAILYLMFRAAAASVTAYHEVVGPGDVLHTDYTGEVRGIMSATVSTGQVNCGEFT